MMRSFFILSFAVTIVFPLVCGCSSVPGNPNLSWLASSDPNRDATAAIAREDFRFWAVNGYAAGMVPGVDQVGSDKSLVEKYGSRTIAGTSDYKNAGFNKRAWNYALAYNSLLLRHLRSPAVAGPQK